MPLADALIKFNAARAAVDGRGVFTKEVADALAKLVQVFNANVSAANSESAAFTAAQFLVATANTELTGERVTTDTATVSWDHATAGQAKANVVDGSITTTKLGGDITTAGKALLDDASAAAQLTTLGVSAFIQTLLDDPDALTARTTLGISSGSATWTEYEIDFGSTPTFDASFTVVDAAVSGTSEIAVVQSGATATGRAAGDAQWDSIAYAAAPGSGQFTLYALAYPGPVVGKRKILYQVGA